MACSPQAQVASKGARATRQQAIHPSNQSEKHSSQLGLALAPGAFPAQPSNTIQTPKYMFFHRAELLTQKNASTCGKAVQFALLWRGEINKN
jgi:hypothetical protein